ncbi:hypothetical protein KFL_013780010, partial [Klebsormidium nitens]
MASDASGEPTLVAPHHAAAFVRAGLLQQRKFRRVGPLPQTQPPGTASGRPPAAAGGGRGQVGTPEKEPEPDPPDLPDLMSADDEDDEKTDWGLGGRDDLTPEQKQALEDLLDEFRDVQAFDMSEMSTVIGEKFTIPVTDDTPIFKRQYRLAYAEVDTLKEQVEERLKCGFIRRSTSPWASPTTMPPKKDEHGNWTLKRPCGDYRALNKVSTPDHYQLPTPEEIFDELETSTWFTTLDLRWGYHQVAIAEEDVCKTAFWGHDGLYEWVVMPFGLKNAPAFFQRLMDTTLSAQRAFCRCYIDDVIIHSKSFEEHLTHLRAVFERLRAKRIKCHPKKMRLAVRTVSYLGHYIVPGGTAPQDVKVEAIVRMIPPRDTSELRAFLGTTNYYRRYVQNYARIAFSLNRLLQNGVAWQWNTEEQEALEQLKLKLTEAPILRRPDFTRPFELHTDWSATGLGAVLAQRDDEMKEYVIAYASRSNNRTERNYSSYHGECLAAVWGVCYFRVYLYGRPFTLITDHEPLQWLMTNTRLTGMHARWANILQEYDVKIVHRSGVKNLDADGLSRNPLPETDDWTDARMDHVSSELPSAVSACLAILAGTLNEPEDPALTELIYGAADMPAPGGSLADTPEESPVQTQARSPAESQALAIVAPLREAADDDVDLPVRFDREIWEDAPVMAYLEAGVYANSVTPKQKDRIWHRARSYQLKDGVLRKRFADGTTKIVPRPELRANLIRRVHQDVGHYGVLKTYSLLSPTYWWVGMYGQVQREVAACTVCDRVKATFDVKDPELKPLPIMGMFYRWGVDLCKMPQISDDGNRYVVVMVEHFTKWIELRAIPAKEAKHVAAAFRDVLTRFGA